MDLILSQQDSFKKALVNWNKLVPAIQKHSESFSGKSGELLKKIREEHYGQVPNYMCTYVYYYDANSFTDSDDEGAFMLLVSIFGKKEAKTKQEPLKFAYNKCKVRYVLSGEFSA